MERFTRRETLIAAGTVAVAGCTGRFSSGNDLPEGCPTTQDIGVELPEDLDAESVASFVETYEGAYFREVVQEYEPESRLDAYEVSVSTLESPTPKDDGYIVPVEQVGAIYQPALEWEGTVSDPPEGVDVISLNDVEDNQLRTVLEETAEQGGASHRVDRPDENVDEYIELFTSLSVDVEPLMEPGESETAYFDVNGTPVELEIYATNRHADVGWTARYFVGEHVVWRARGADEDPRNGELLECRK